MFPISSLSFYKNSRKKAQNTQKNKIDIILVPLAPFCGH